MFFRQKNFISQKIRQAVRENGLRQSSNLSPWLQEARTVNQHQGEHWYSSKSGTYFSKKTQKMMQWESKNEEAILKELETMPDVIWFDTQCIKFSYSGTEDEYEYTPDIVVRMEYNQTVIIEAKPAKTVCDWENYRKYLAAKQMCGRNDWHFIILSAKEGTIEDMTKRHISDVVERDFNKRMAENPTGRFGGLKWDELKEFQEKYDLKDRDLITIALRNDCTFYKEPSTCTKLPSGYSWSKILR